MVFISSTEIIIIILVLDNLKHIAKTKKATQRKYNAKKKLPQTRNTMMINKLQKEMDVEGFNLNPSWEEETKENGKNNKCKVSYIPNLVIMKTGTLGFDEVHIYDVSTIFPTITKMEQS